MQKSTTIIIAVIAAVVVAGAAVGIALAVNNSNNSSNDSSKTEPVADDFVFTAPSDLVNSNDAKSATVSVKDGISGMGGITVKYYTDKELTKEIAASNVKDAGTYYVAISVAEGDKYFGVSKIYSESWSFEIMKDIKDSIVGCHFLYDVYGNSGDDNDLISGTLKVSVLGADDTRYQMKYEYDTYTTNSLGEVSEFIKSSETKWIDKTEYSEPSSDVSDKNIHTYWGNMDCKKYVHENAEAKEVCYNGYDGAVIFEGSTVKDDYTMIIMLNETDFINLAKTDSPHKFTLSMSATIESDGYFDYTIDETISIKNLNSTSTWSLLDTTTAIISDFPLIPSTNARTVLWTEDTSDSSEEDADYGQFVEKVTLATSWGNIIVDKYSKTETEDDTTTTTTTYLVENEFMIKQVAVKVSASETSTTTVEITGASIDGTEISDVKDLMKIEESDLWA